MKKLSLILGLIGVLVIVFFIGNTNPKIECQSLIENEKSDQYSGIVTDKYIDQDQHMYEKVVLNTDLGTEVVLTDWETSGFYDFLKIGDSISKNPNSLEVKIWRNNRDTIYNLKFYCLEDR